MNFKKIKKVALLIIIVIATMITSTVSKAVGSYPAGIGIAPAWGSGIYCTEHEATLAPTVTYGKATTINYGGGSTEEADIIVAYALYLGLQGAELQNVIWASSNNTGMHVELSNERVKEYKTVHDEIFAKAGANIVTHTENRDDLKVLVDRPNGTYMVGPYKLDLAVDASAGAKSALLNEIKTGTAGTSGGYALFEGITGINGEIQELVYSDGSVVASGNGLAYGFPDFGKEFYIRFKPANEGAIVRTGRPTFKLKFMRNVTGTVTKFNATSVDYELDVEEYDAVKIAKAKGKVKFPDPPSNGPKNTTHKQTETVEVEMKIELKHHLGSVIATEKRTEKVTFERSYSYDDNGKLSYVGGKKVKWVSETTSSGSVSVSYSGNYATDVQTLGNTSSGQPEWHEENNEKPEIPDYEYEIKEGEGYKYELQPEDGKGITLPDALIDMQIGGHVWIEEGEVKEGTYDGKKGEKEKPYAGMQVDLYQADGTLVTTTTTDKNGRYRFYGMFHGFGSYEPGVLPALMINPLKQYYVVFEYDGQRYQATYSYSDISSPGGFSNAREIGREEFNAKFKTIYSNPDNYDNASFKVTDNSTNASEVPTKKRAYGIDHKIVKDDGEYAVKEGEVALTYEDVYDKLLELSTSQEFDKIKKGDCLKSWYFIGGTVYKVGGNSYYKHMDELKEWLSQKGVKKEFENIQSFIFDTLIKASTKKDAQGNDILYPKYDKFVVKELYNTSSADYVNKTTKTITVGDTYTYLYSINYDMARYVDFGVCRRLKADIRLQKDIYKTTLIVNGKKEEYEYNKRDLSADSRYWDVRVRASDELYNSIYNNGEKAYQRDVRASEYLLGSENVGDEKTLKAYVTYKIAFKNSGNCNVSVKEIVDHYDAEGYEFDSNDPIIKENTYIGEYDGTKIEGKKLNTSEKGIRGEGKSTISGDNYKYNNLYLTGMDELLTPGNVVWLYVTFRVQNDETTGKVKLDYVNDPYRTSKNELQLSVGKRNIAEINAYETYYVRNNGITTIPNYLEKGTKTVDTDVNGKVAGLIDYDSNPGNLTTLDLGPNGNLKITNTDSPIDGKEGLLVTDRQEDDSSQAPNIRIIIDNPDDHDDEIRRLKGYVYEDNRTNKSEDATIGNGEYEDGETKVNGVRVQLVELVSEVDEKGISKHTYTGEKIWESYRYYPNSNELAVEDESRYNSGDGRTKIIINGPSGTIFDVSNEEKDKLDYNNGEYVFKSLPAGDFYIRFIYGDDYGNTLVNNEKLNGKISYLVGKIGELSSATSDEQKIELDQYKTELDRAIKNQQVNTTLGAEGRNAKSYNGQDYKSTTYQVGLGQSGDYYGIKGYTNYEGQNYTEGEELNDGTNKGSMYYYDIAEGDHKQTVSDAKDVWYYRNKSNTYSKGADGNILMNKRAEILASFERPASYTITGGEILDDGTSYGYKDNGEKVYDYENGDFKNMQVDMLNQFMDNTKMTAQTGIINTEIERNRDETTYDLDQTTRDTRTLKYLIDNINLGLVERPKAQLKLNKEVSNYKLMLYNGQVLFDAQKSVNNLSFSGHVQHSAEKDDLGLFRLGEPRVGRPGFGKNEIIQNYVDNEMLANSMVGIDYEYFVENVGETDYTDKEFYYTGNENNAQANISKTKAVRVVDYVANTLGFSTETQTTKWTTSSADILIPSKDNSNEDANFVNRLYNPEMKTYKTLITSDEFGDELAPGERKNGKLVLLSQATDNNTDSKVYCNMSEIIATSNDVGRRCVYSIPGNEEMADQNLGNDAASGAKTSMNRIQVSEIDADSSQEVRLLPPTGTETGIKMNTTAIDMVKSIMAEGIASIKLRLTK